MKIIKSVLVFATCFSIAQVTIAQVPVSGSTPSTQQSTPPAVQKAQQDSLNKMRQTESAHDKSVIREQQKGKPDSGRVVTPTMRDNTVIDNQQNPNNRVNAQTQQPGQKQPPHANAKPNQQPPVRAQEPAVMPPSRSQIVTKTITTADGKTITKEYYRDVEVATDENGRKYILENNRRTYFVDDNKMKPVPDTRDDRNPEIKPKQ
jgi:hypothetical protein